jgi:hypothetical protein
VGLVALSLITILLGHFRYDHNDIPAKPKVNAGMRPSGNDFDAGDKS